MIELPSKSRPSRTRLPDDDIKISGRTYKFKELDKALKQTTKNYRQQGINVNSYGIPITEE